MMLPGVTMHSTKTAPAISLKTFLTALLCCILTCMKAQQPVTIHPGTNEYIFTYSQIHWLEDTSGNLTFQEVRRLDTAAAFQPNTGYYPKNVHQSSAYWFKVRVTLTDSIAANQRIIEFFDQTIDDLTVYLPQANGEYISSHSGAGVHFSYRLYRHKNFEFQIPDLSKGTYTYYVRVKSLNEINFIMVYRSMVRFINYALVEYITYGLFYGMILVFCFYNLLMLLATGLSHYLYYVLYIVSVGLFEMSTDGIAFQFIWPGYPGLNVYMYGISLYCMSIFALIFARTLLRVKRQSPVLYRVLNGIILLRTIYFLICLLLKKEWFIYKFLDFIPLFASFIAGLIIWYKGFKPARFFVLGYALLFAGAIVKLVNVLGLVSGNLAVAAHYGLVLGFVLEMVFLSFSIGDQVRLLRKEKKQAQDDAFFHIQRNLKLQANINQQLEEQVAARTEQLALQAQEIYEQAQEIARMNKLLEKDNEVLKTNIEKITDARITATELTFEEFSHKYPDQEKCYQFLADLKWNNGFSCKKCNYTNFSKGRRPYSRRCNKCAYEESPLNDTIFENNRIPINKAFYIVYLVFITKGNISSYQIAEKTGMRQGTCWAYAVRIKNLLDATKKNKKTSWTDLIRKT
ncbi:Transposase zinc-ribbon domain-containing protein [Chitinophaga jiangningensis]|uniref:Transposase zinc-ribbon domain-containing protein n=1 Tax=Chitinophaga jiangningensis TaxID=1419482 RepID=A0A1M7KB34_9BACT|nr:7TM diverse intracellular signaling domain-containing protein [Chitinophaga jiangningensis]SHM62203.1 Transposase zinc-ribbon domain-containing protein [Chitinophaga jiangningensis]